MTGQPIKLIYVCGYGRSGTTLFDIYLGQDPEIFGAGEIATIARHVWVNDEYCACNRPVSHCPVWAEIVDRWKQGEGPDFLAEYRADQEYFEGLGSAFRRLSGPRFDEFTRRTVKLLRLMAEVSGRPILLDSSKMPGRGFALAAMKQIDLHAVHVVRDGRGVAWSLMKPYARKVESGLQKEIVPKSWAYTAVRWSLVNLVAEKLCRKLGRGRSIRVRYEDFAADPAAVVTRIMAMVRPGSPTPVTAGEIVPGHQVAGNRLRMQPSIRVRRDESWRREMPARQQRTFAFACAPLMLRYGYELGVEAEAEAEPALRPS